MRTYINFTIKHVVSIEKTNEPDVYWVLFDDPSDINIYGPCSDEAEQKFRHAVKTCVKVHKGFGWPIYRERYCIRMRIEFDGHTFDEFLGNVLNTGRADGVLTINDVDDAHIIYKFEITRVNPRTAFTINRAVEIRTAKMGNLDDDKFLIFFERDEDGEPKIDIYSEDHDTISAINKKLKESPATKRYYLLASACGKVTEPRCRNGFFTANGYIKDNGDIVITSYEEVNCKEEKDMRRNVTTVEKVYNGMTDAQQKVCQLMVGEALKNATRSFDPDSIKKVIYNDPATIIFWSDGTKTIVKCMEDEDYDPEKGFMAAVTKKVFGDKYGWVMRHQVKPIVEREKNVDTLMDSIADTLRRRRTAQESAMAIRDQMLVSGATQWELETFDRFVRKYISDKEDK
jgi:hypothetical protein